MEQNNKISLEKSIERVNKKIIERSPHVFGDKKATTLKEAIRLMHNPEIDSLWEYEGQDGQTLWKAYTEGQYCDIYSSCTALKHDGKITPMGQDLLDSTEMIK